MTDIVKRLRWLAKEDPWRPRVEIAAQAADEIERLRGEIERLRAALKDMLHAVCGETGFAAAVRAHSETAYPWEPLDIAEEKARAALRESNRD